MTFCRRFRPLAFFLVAASGALAFVAGPGGAGAGTLAADTEVIREIVFPVAGEHRYSDTFGACRGVNCSRGHEGSDIMADRLTPLVAARDARVRWLETDATPDGSSGNYVFLEDDEGWQYWYIHLNNDSPGTDDGANPPEWILGPGIERGARVTAGQLVGYVGDSGNAESTAPHLHFEIHNPDGEVINPHRSLRAAVHVPSPVTDRPDGSPEAAFVAALTPDFLGRAPSDVELVGRTAALAADSTRGDLIREYAGSDEWVWHLVDTYYRGTLGRSGEPEGWAYWADVIRDGRSPALVAADFYASDEYHARVGGTDTAWLTDLASQLLGAEPTAEQLAGWIAQLEVGALRTTLAHELFQSREHRSTRVHGLYDALLGREPDAGGLDYWIDVLADGHDLKLATYLAASDEYATRAVSRFTAPEETETVTPATGSDDESEGEGRRPRRPRR